MARRHGGTRRKTQWAGFGSSGGSVAIPVPIVLVVNTPQIISLNAIINGAAGFLDEEVTITRTIGMITAQMDVDTAEAIASVSLGLGVFRDEAVNAGVASIPSPEDDPDFEWLMFSSFALVNPMNALRDGPVSGVHIPFDVRGQRVMRAGQTVAWVAESQGQNVAVGVNGRYLMKLT